MAVNPVKPDPLPENLNAVIIPVVFALKSSDNVTAKSTFAVPSKETADVVETSPETLKFLEVSS